MAQQFLTDAEVVTPDISHIVTEDDTSVDNFQSEKQQRLLVEPLYSSPVLPSPFIVAANVGIFHALKQPPIVPDAFLSLGVAMPSDWSQKQNRSYFVWEFGKVPEVCIEVVSNREGEELTGKKAIYARIGVPYYAVFDPLEQLQSASELNESLLKVWALNAGAYTELAAPFWLGHVGLGLTLWEGEFEAVTGIWLRWCLQDGSLILTGKERADREQQRANQLADRLRKMGIDPDQV